MTTIQISSINSAEILSEAARMGATTATLLGTGYSPAEARPDNAVTIYEVGGVRVATTNGGCVWEEWPRRVGWGRNHDDHDADDRRHLHRPLHNGGERHRGSHLWSRRQPAQRGDLPL